MTRPLELRRILEDDLASIVGDWPDLLNLAASTGGIVTGGADDPRLPGGTQRMSLIASTHSLVTSWCLVVIADRDLDGGSVGEDTPDRVSFLITHAEWLSTHEAATDATSELHEAAQEIRALVAPSGVRRIPIGACPVLDCGGAVQATLTDGATDSGPDLVCDLDRDHCWPEPQYQRLAELLGCDGPERLTIPALVDHIAGRFARTILPATVKSWVARHPLSLDWREDEHTVDRIKAIGYYLDRRAAKAGHAA